MLVISCSICHVNLEINDNISALLCGHVYHQGCIEKWFKLKNTCPVCRKDGKKSFIKKLFFCDLNNNSQPSFNESNDKLLCNISKLELLNGELEKKMKDMLFSKNKLQESFDTIVLYNESISQELDNQKKKCAQCEMIVKNKESELDYMTKKCRKLELLESVMKASSLDVSSRIDKLMHSDDVMHKIEVLNVALLTSSKEMESYKEKMAQLTHQNRQYSLKNRLLQNDIDQIRKEYTECQKENETYSSQLKDFDSFVSKRFSNRQHFSLNSSTSDCQEDLNMSDNVENIFKNVPPSNDISLDESFSSSNPFVCESKTPRFVLDLSIMKNATSKVGALKTSNAANNIGKKRLPKLKSQVSKKIGIQSFFTVK